VNRIEYLINGVQQLFTGTVNQGIRASIPSVKYFVELNTDQVREFGVGVSVMAPLTGWDMRRITFYRIYASTK
jgi:hypothetical protein